MPQFGIRDWALVLKWSRIPKFCCPSLRGTM